MRMYIQEVNDAGELNGIPYELITCKDCVHFKFAYSDKLRPRGHICHHPDAMVNPSPDSWCSLGEAKDHGE